MLAFEEITLIWHEKYTKTTKRHYHDNIKYCDILTHDNRHQLFLISLEHSHDLNSFQTLTGEEWLTSCSCWFVSVVTHPKHYGWTGKGGNKCWYPCRPSVLKLAWAWQSCWLASVHNHIVCKNEVAACDWVKMEVEASATSTWNLAQIIGTSSENQWPGSINPATGRAFDKAPLSLLF